MASRLQSITLQKVVISMLQFREWQCIQDPGQINASSLWNVRCGTRSNFRNKKQDYLKCKRNGLEVNRTRTRWNLCALFSHKLHSFIVVSIELVRFLQIPTEFWIGGRITSVSYWLYLGQMVFGRVQYLQLCQWCMSLVALALRWPLKI